HAVPPQESVDRTVRGDGYPHDLAGVVDAVRDRGATAQIPEVPDNAGLPEDGVRDAVGADATAHDLARGVDVPRGAELVSRQTSGSVMVPAWQTNGCIKPFVERLLPTAWPAAVIA